MKASEAIEITKRHSKEMQAIYESITASAKRGNREVAIHNGVPKECLEILKENGFHYTYETSETDGGQFLVIVW